MVDFFKLQSLRPEQIANPGNEPERRQSFPLRHHVTPPQHRMNFHTHPTHTPIHQHSYTHTHSPTASEMATRLEHKVESSSRRVFRKFAGRTWGRQALAEPSASITSAPSIIISSFDCFSGTFSCFFPLGFLRFFSPPHFSFALSPSFSLFHLLRSRYPQCG
jgi:hypothetical protein